MACFIAPATEAVITTIAQHIAKKHEKPAQNGELRLSERLGLLNRLLWGGSALLAFEHVWHGEVTPFFPFLTAASNPEDAAEMLREMGTVGVGMAVLVTGVWVGMVLAAKAIAKRPAKEEEAAEAES